MAMTVVGLYRRDPMIADEPDRPGTDDGDDIAGTDLTVEHADLVAGRQDVGQHQHCFVADAGGNRIGRQVGERNSHELGLRAVDLVAEDPTSATEALAAMALAAVLARAARRDARDQHAVSDLDSSGAVADSRDCADGLVAEDATVGDCGHVALHDVQVGAADRGGLDVNDRVGAIDDHRISYFFPCLLARTVIHESLHQSPLLSRSWRSSVSDLRDSIVRRRWPSALGQNVIGRRCSVTQRESARPMWPGTFVSALRSQADSGGPGGPTVVDQTEHHEDRMTAAATKAPNAA